MGNQHSAPDKDKEREPPRDTKDRDKSPAAGGPVRAASRHEKHRSRPVPSSTPLPPAETKVNADHSHSVPTSATPQSIPVTTTTTTSASSDSRSLEPRTSIESSSVAGSGGTSPAKTRHTSKTIAQKDVMEAIKDVNINKLPPSGENISNEAEGLEPTPKFETVRVPSQTSLVDDEEDAEEDNGNSVIVEDLRVAPEKVPLVLDWNDGGKKVTVAGTFTGWRKRINLRKTYGPHCTSWGRVDL
jgi:hypothetical protein